MIVYAVSRAYEGPIQMFATREGAEVYMADEEECPSCYTHYIEEWTVH